METYNLYQYLPYWNKQGEEFRKLIGDLEKEEKEEITNINDINRGSIHNALYWHVRTQARAVKETNLLEAKGIYLDYWGELLDIPRPFPMEDPEYAGYIVQKILSGVLSLPSVKMIFPDQELREPPEVGFYADHGHTDNGPINPLSPYFYNSGVISHKNNSVYVFFDDLNDFTLQMKGRLFHIAAGTGIFIGEY